MNDREVETLYIKSLAILLGYFVAAAGTALGCRLAIRIPNEIFRKILHMILLGSLLVFVVVFETWWEAALTAVGFAVAVYPVLACFERVRGYSELTTERKKGELKSSLLMVFGMFALVVCVCGGWLGDRHLVIAVVYAWGVGDAGAALIGKRFGRHKIHLPFVDEKKSWEGSGTMFVLSFLSVLAVLLLRGGMGMIACVVTAAVTAFVSAAAELWSKGGTDTVICPLAAMAVLLPAVYLFGGLA